MEYEWGCRNLELQIIPYPILNNCYYFQVSNTMDILKLVEGCLNVNDISQAVKSPKCGAISLFIGTTRDNFDGHQVCKNK